MSDVLLLLGVATAAGLYIYSLIKKRENGLMPTKLQEHILDQRRLELELKKIEEELKPYLEKSDELYKNYNGEFRSVKPAPDDDNK